MGLGLGTGLQQEGGLSWLQLPSPLPSSTELLSLGVKMEGREEDISPSQGISTDSTFEDGCSLARFKGGDSHWGGGESTTS